MGGSTTTNTNSSSQSINEIPQWVQQAGQQNYALAANVAGQPLQQYQGQLVAGVSPQMQQAFDLAANSGSVGQGALNGAQAALLSGANYTPQNVTADTLSGANLVPYMNPYTEAVINKTLPIMQQGLALQENQQANQANAANAFGGSRFGVQQGVTQAQGAMNEGQMAAQLNAANFAQAQQGALADIANKLKAQQGNQAAGLTANAQQIGAGSALGTLGGQQMQNNLANYGMLTSAGGLEEQQQQNQINAQIAKFQQAWQYPQQQLGIMESSLGMTPYNTGTSGSSASQSETQTSNPAAIAGGAFGMLGSLFGGPAGAGIGTGIGKLIGGSHGITKVPGQRMSAKHETDSVPAMLAPGEAVLNRHAAEHLGRSKIASLNADGAKSMPPRGYAGGTSNVEPVDPKRLQALISTLKNRDVGSDAYFSPQHPNQSTASPARPGDVYGMTPAESLALERAVGPNLLSYPEDYRPPGYAYGTPRIPGLLGRRRNIIAPAALNVPPSSPGVARAIGMLAPSSTPGRLSPFATPPTRSALSMLPIRRRSPTPRIPIMGALGG